MDIVAPFATRGPVLVIGGANTDIAGFPNAPLVAADSNPGQVRTSPGGVARNVAENLARFGAEVSLLTAFGSDHNGRALAEECRSVGIDTAPSLVLDDVPGSLYLAILDEVGDMALALSDMRALERVTPEVLRARASFLDGASLVVVDANLSVESLAWIAENTRAPIVLDTVSVAKAPRAAGLLGRIDTMKATAIEARVLTGLEIDDPDSGLEAARRLRALGVARAFVSLGAQGVCYAGTDGEGVLPPPPVHLVNASGAGDAFTAGLAYARNAGLPMRESAAFASAAAGVSLESESTVAAFEGISRAVSIMKEMLT